mgnify:CR=1 FL=1
MNYLIAFLGSLIYNFALFVKAKDNCEKSGAEVDYGRYFKMNWDNWALTLMVAPVIVWFLPDIALIVDQKVFARFDFQVPVQAYALSAGPMTEVVLFGVFKIIGWKRTWVAPVHIDEKNDQN